MTNQGTPYHYVHLPNQASWQAIKYERIETLLYLNNNKVINVLEALFNNITFEGTFVINKCTYIINIY